ncbi:tetratricopeptide repeat protein [bacterium]|nr:MAG: tetratricopeptide repeat protein [bacterium]
MLTAGAVQTEILGEKWDGEKYYLKARIKADPIEVAKSIDRLRKDETKSKELDDAKKRSDDALKEIEKLKAELDAVKNDKTKQLEYAKQANVLSAEDWFYRGYAFDEAKDYDTAIEAYTKAISLNPDDAHAYNNRGNAYTDKGQYDRAIEDFNKAISLNPDDAEAYYNRGVVYGRKGQYDREIEDYNKACELGNNQACEVVKRLEAVR